MFISLFKNTYKVEGDNKPEYNASMKIDDKFANVGGGWVKQGKSGEYISLRLEDDKILEQLGSAAIEKGDKVNLDEIPF